jgi:hypothetical protein
MRIAAHQFPHFSDAVGLANEFKMRRNVNFL